MTSAPKRARLNAVESGGGVAYCAGDRGVLLERAAPGEWRAVFTAGQDGDGGQLRISEAGGNFAPVENELGGTFYGAEVMANGSVTRSARTG